MVIVLAIVATSLVGFAVGYGAGWLRGLRAERRGCYDAWAARLADERDAADARCAARARRAAEAAFAAELAERRGAALTVAFGPEIQRPSRRERN